MNNWTPLRTFLLADILEAGHLGGIRCGTSTQDCFTLLGPPELPAARLGRRSSLQLCIYGNCAFTLEHDTVISIGIEFGGPRTSLVTADSLQAWGEAEWMAYSGDRQASLRTEYDVVTITLRNGVRVQLNSHWQLHSVTLFTCV